MKVVVQRVLEAKVEVNEKIVGQIDNGLLLLVAFTHNDDINTIKYIANKIINLRIFDDSNGVMNLSCLDKNYGILSISQFTLYGDASKGNRPSYSQSLKQEEAIKLYNLFNEELRKSKLKVETGIFREYMKIYSINDGPATIIIER